jgi:hypothetical protein
MATRNPCVALRARWGYFGRSTGEYSEMRLLMRSMAAAYCACNIAAADAQAVGNTITADHAGIGKVQAQIHKYDQAIAVVSPSESCGRRGERADTTTARSSRLSPADK